MGRILTGLFVVLICGNVALKAHAQQLPSPIDLKAAYCVPVLDYSIALLSDNHPMRSEFISRRRRLTLFLMPRIDSLDSSSIVVALSRGKEDVSKLSEIQRVCNLKCGNVGNLDKLIGCQEQCGGEYDAVKQIRTCNDLNWLPF
jgi:hypothetical protein